MAPEGGVGVEIGMLLLPDGEEFLDDPEVGRSFDGTIFAWLDMLGRVVRPQPTDRGGTG
jgi:hypothetical protein